MNSSPPSRLADRTRLRRYRAVLLVFMLGLVVSGLTAFPLQRELDWLTAQRGLEHLSPADATTGLDHWLLTVRDGLHNAYAASPWLAYGTDWLAFAHLVLALFFLGPLLNPIRNVWVLKAGLVACLLVLPLALICGPLRGIPFGWRLIDCSFGIAGSVPLGYCLWQTRRLAAGNQQQAESRRSTHNSARPVG